MHFWEGRKFLLEEGEWWREAKTKFLFESVLGQNINTLRGLSRYELKSKTRVDAQLESVKVTTFFSTITALEKSGIDIPRTHL